MHEESLKNYFEGNINIMDLLDDIVGTKVKVGPKETSFNIISMKSVLQLNANYILKLLRDILEHQIDPNVLEIIALAIEASENIEYGEEDCKNDLMVKMLNEWSAPEINYELNSANVKRCLQKLEEKL